MAFNDPLVAPQLDFLYGKNKNRHALSEMVSSGESTLDALKTTDKTNLVGAINEVVNGRAINYSSTATMRHVTNRVAIPTAVSGSNTHNSFRVWQISYVPITKIRIAIPNWYVSASPNSIETGAGSAMTCLLSVEYPKGTFTRITWGDGGATSGTIADGDTGYAEMTLPFTIPPFTYFRIAGDCTWTGAGRALSTTFSNNCDRGNGDEYFVGAGADNTMNSTYMGTATNYAGMFMPIAVMSMSTKAVWAVLGDSIAAGVNDTFFDPNGGRGIAGRPLAQHVPHMNFGLPGDRADKFIASHDKRLAVLQAAGVTGVILELGVNDLNNARTSANLLADRTTIRGYFPTATIWDTTITPSTTSTDTFKTAANQTVVNSGYNTARTTFNDALRQGLQTGSTGVIDVASVIETATTNEVLPTVNGGVWLPGMVGSADGIHPSTRGYRAIAELFSSAILTRR